MKKKLIVCLLLILSFIGGFFCSVTINNIQKVIKSFNSSTTYSIDFVREKCSLMGIELPKQAWDVDFHWRENRDPDCFLAFSASKEDIVATIKKLKEDTPKNDRNFSIPVPVDDQGRALDWWPANSLNMLDAQRGMFYWAGYDTHHSRIYIYRFTE